MWESLGCSSSTTQMRTHRTSSIERRYIEHRKKDIWSSRASFFSTEQMRARETRTERPHCTGRRNADTWLSHGSSFSSMSTVLMRMPETEEPCDSQVSAFRRPVQWGLS